MRSRKYATLWSRLGIAATRIGLLTVISWSRINVNVKANAPALMTQTLAELVYQAIELAMDTDVAVSNAVLDGHRVWLHLSNKSFSILENEFLVKRGASSPTVAAIEPSLSSSEVVEALDIQLNSGTSVIQTLLEARHHAFDTEPWELTLLARAKIAGQYVFVGTGFELVSKCAYWLAIAETSDPESLRDYQLPTEPIHRALNDSTPVMAAALTHSPQALAAIIDLDKALKVLPEKHALLAATGHGTRARLPTSHRM